MINKLKKIGLTLTLACATFLPAVNAFGADPVYVKLNGVPIIYEDATPQILNQRAMVPFRKTAETLGATVEWNKQTETATFRKGDRVVLHTIRSKVITVNGKAYTFDTPSAIIQDRTMMPVRMLSEALGNKVNWDNNTRTVDIIADEPTVISIVPDKTKVNNGEKINIAITTNSSTDKIKVVDTNENNVVVAEANTYITNPDGTRLFSIPWVPSVTKTTLKTLKAVPGTLMSYNETNEAAKFSAIGINADIKPKITSFTVDKKDVGRGEKIKLTIEANENTKRIRIDSSKKEKLVELVNYRLINNDNTKRIFETEFTMEDRGDIEFKAYAGNDQGYESSYESLKVTVGGSGSSASNEKLKIKDTIVLNDDIYVDEEVKIIIKTSTDIDKVEILNGDDRVLGSTRYASIKNNSEYVWDINVTAKESGRNRLYIVAYNKDNDKVKDNTSFNASNYSSRDLVILNTEQRDIGAISGDNVKFKIRTTDRAERIELFEGSTKLEETKDYSNSGSVREWEIRTKVTNSNKDSLRIRAYDKEGKETSTKLNVYLDEKASGKIYDFNLREREVSKNEYIRVDVYTNKAISKVWIEDSNDGRVAISTSYDSVSGDEYTWSLRFPAEEVGSSVRYTIYAEDENGKKYDETFRVKVNR